MIVCISPNPAIDRRLRVGTFESGKVNRVISFESFAGGKAAHVAMAATALGEREVIWMGFLGGSTGAEIERQLNELGITVLAVRTKSPTRRNDEIIDRNGLVTEILEPGGTVSQEEVGSFYSTCREVFGKARGGFHAALSGSLPTNAPEDFYKRLIVLAREFGGKSILDTSGTALIKGLEAGPDVIKPNAEEAGKAVGAEIGDTRSAIIAADRLLEMGVVEPIISLGQNGLLRAKRGEQAMLARPPQILGRSAVGSGDATVAGLLVSEIRGYGAEDRLRFAAACGAANCYAPLPGQIDVSEVDRQFEKVSIEYLEH